jgi:uncharacterized protein YjbI with pentapeptide repeats
MKGRGWLHALLGVLAGAVLGRRLVQQRKPKPIQSRRAATEKPSGNRRLTREDLLRMIEENGGPQGLQLVGQNLSGIDLSFRAIREELRKRGIAHTGHVPWYSADTHGANMKGIVFRDANLSEADLFQADLSSANLRGAQLQGAVFHDAKLTGCVLVKADAQHADFTCAVLQGAYLQRAILQGANLRGAQSQGANFFQANLDGAILWDANLENAELAEAVLTNVNLFGARLSNIYMTKEQLGGKIIQDDVDYRDPTSTHPMPPSLGRCKQAQIIYRELKNNFYGMGLYEDGSWAYVRERRSRRATYNPRWARQYYGAELPGETSLLSWRLWWFYLKYTWKWLLDWAAELSCGYGEKPLRTLVWALAVILIFPLFYWLSGGIVSVGGTPLTWLDYLNYSFGAFTTIGFARFVTANWIAETLTSLEALLGISVLALLMFALGNRISRS